MLSLMKYFGTHSDFKALLKFLSPKIFQVVTGSDLLIFARKMSSKALSPTMDYEELSQFCKKTGPICDYSISVLPPRTHCSQKIPNELLGQVALELYFRQLFQANLWNLDLAPERFYLTEQTLTWSPKPLFWKVDPHFAESIQKMYLGFYCSQMPLFEEGLNNIHLLPAKDVFLEYFGHEDQTQTCFELKKFQKAFDRIFGICLESQIQLPPDFLALGILMLTLYQNLESSGLTYNIKNIFKKFTPSEAQNTLNKPMLQVR